ncbi:MAG: hypothetical protein SOW59_02560 [Corynebacterium sp.]|nr:hypothetical protein [Corynebacterium sp.]
MSQPKPRDPDSITTTPAYIDQAIVDIFAAPELEAAESLAKYAQRLDDAHEVLRQALQES